MQSYADNECLIKVFWLAIGKSHQEFHQIKPNLAGQDTLTQLQCNLPTICKLLPMSFLGVGNGQKHWPPHCQFQWPPFILILPDHSVPHNNVKTLFSFDFHDILLSGLSSFFYDCSLSSLQFPLLTPCRLFFSNVLLFWGGWRVFLYILSRGK